MLPSSFFQRRLTRMGGAVVLSEGLALEQTWRRPQVHS